MTRCVHVLLTFITVPVVALAPWAGMAAENPVGISEVHYHAADAAPGSEFVELANRGSEAVDLSGWRFDAGIEFAFPSGTELPDGGRLVVCADRAAFRAAFGDAVRVAGVFDKRLANAGERLRLVDREGRRVFEFRYDDRLPWPEEADGGGSSLQRVMLERSPDDPSGWHAASPTPGAPGAASGDAGALSVFRVRHEPVPVPAHAAITVSAAVYHETPVALVLRYEFLERGAHRDRGAVPLALTGARRLARGRESTATATLPPATAGTVVRYWIETGEDHEGVPSRWPAPEAGTPCFAFRVGPSPVAGELPAYEFLVGRDALARLGSRNWSDETSRATFLAGEEVYDSVQVRIRGAWARTWPKKSWKVVFNDDRRFDGRGRLNLNSCWRDPAFVRETLAYDTYARCGAPSLETRMVRVQVNDSFWGLFVEVEQPRGEFLERHGMAGAVLYKAASDANRADERRLGSLREYSQHYEIETGEDAGFTPLASFCRRLEETDDALAFLEANVELERYTNYLCATVLTQNWDAFSKNHFVVWDRAGSGKWCAVPWDLDRTLGDHWNQHFESFDLSPLLGTQALPGPTGWNRLAERYFSVPALRRRFFERLGELLEEVFTDGELFPRIDALGALIARDAARDRERWGGPADFAGALEALKRFVRQRREFLLRQLPGGEPATPSNARPAAGEAVRELPVVLESSPFAHESARVTHEGSRWQVRAASGDYSSPVFEQTTTGPVRALELPAGLLLPETLYWSRVAHVGSNGKSSAFSAETAFVTPSFRFEAVPVDLVPHFNRDVIANPGDRTQEPLDPYGGYLLVDGWDGQRPDNPTANGLPRHGRVGVHRLGDYDGANALQIRRAAGGPVRLAVAPDRYACFRFLVTGADGDSSIPVRIEYEEGEATTGAIPCDDWYDDHPPDGPPEAIQPGSVPILNGMDRMRESFKDRNDPALFEVVIPVDRSRVVRGLVLDPERGSFERARTLFNLFAVTGIRVD